MEERCVERREWTVMGEEGVKFNWMMMWQVCGQGGFNGGEDEE